MLVCRPCQEGAPGCRSPTTIPMAAISYAPYRMDEVTPAWMYESMCEVMDSDQALEVQVLKPLMVVFTGPEEKEPSVDGPFGVICFEIRSKSGMPFEAAERVMDSARVVSATELQQGIL
eukprot:jgi/Ulvmu1/4484/UM002_0209.1